jgi:hypothetical protein
VYLEDSAEEAVQEVVEVLRDCGKPRNFNYLRNATDLLEKVEDGLFGTPGVLRRLLDIRDQVRLDPLRKLILLDFSKVLKCPRIQPGGSRKVNTVGEWGGVYIALTGEDHLKMGTSKSFKTRCNAKQPPGYLSLQGIDGMSSVSQTLKGREVNVVNDVLEEVVRRVPSMGDNALHFPGEVFDGGICSDSKRRRRSLSGSRTNISTRKGSGKGNRSPSPVVGSPPIDTTELHSRGRSLRRAPR